MLSCFLPSTIKGHMANIFLWFIGFYGCCLKNGLWLGWGVFFGGQFEGQNNIVGPQSIREPLFLLVQSVGTLGPLKQPCLIRKENMSPWGILEQSRWYANADFFCTSALTLKSVYASFHHFTGANCASAGNSAVIKKPNKKWLHSPWSISVIDESDFGLL